MVALLHPDAGTDTQSVPSPSGLRLVVDNTKKPIDAPDDLSGQLPSLDRSLVVAVAVAAVVVFGGLFALRSIQGVPAEASAGQAAPTDAQVAPGDQIIVAKAGDSMWSIAVALRPESDPRPAVEALIEANGGDSVRIGQQIVIPEQLLD